MLQKPLPIDYKRDRRQPGEGEWTILGRTYPRIKTHPVYHPLVVSGTGGGKTETIGLPVCYEILVHRPQHLIFTAPKGNELEKLKRAGAIPEYYLYSFDPRTPQTSSLNPIASPDLAEGFFDSLMNHHDSPDPYWGASASRLAQAIASAIGYRSLVDVYEAARSPEKLDELAKHSRELHINWTQQETNRENFRSHIETALKSLAQPHIRKLFAPGASEPPFGPHHRDVVAVRTPLDPGVRKAWAPLINAAFTHLWRSALDGFAAGGFGCYWIIDEARAVLNLHLLADWISTGRSEGQRLMPIFQALGQIEEVVGQAGADTILASTDLKLFGRTNSRKEADKMSRYSGSRYSERSVRQDAHQGALSRKINTWTGRVRYQTREVEEPMLSADEIMSFGAGVFASMWGSKENTEIIKGRPFESYQDVLAARNIYPQDQARQLGIAPEPEAHDDTSVPEPGQDSQTRPCLTCGSPIEAETEECAYCGEPL